MFNSYRGKELGNVEAIGTMRLKVTGEGDSATKWLTITPNELEKIIAVLEPEDYRQATAGIIQTS